MERALIGIERTCQWPPRPGGHDGVVAVRRFLRLWRSDEVERRG
jgi:hypothetical protein